MRAYGRNRSFAALILNLDGGERSASRPDKRSSGAREPVWKFGEEKNCRRDSNPDRPASSEFLY